MCSLTLSSDSVPLQNNVPTPTFVWSFGPSGDDSLPPGVTDMGTTSSDSITFTSTLQFSPLSQCHIGMYTCQLGSARLVTSIMVTVNGIAASIYTVVSRVSAHGCLNIDHDFERLPGI